MSMIQKEKKATQMVIPLPFGMKNYRISGTDIIVNAQNRWLAHLIAIERGLKDPKLLRLVEHD